MKTYEKTAELMKKYREKKGWLLSDVAFNIDVPISQILSIENGKSGLPLDKLKKICQVLGIPKKELKKSMMHNYYITIDNYLGTIE